MKNDVRSSAGLDDLPVRTRLLDAAERLFAVHGFEGVSLRQISAEAGTRNNYAVQSHFGDLDGLIRAIVERRAPEMELRRAELLAELVGTDAPSIRDLFKVIYQPLIEGGKPGEPAVVARIFLSLLTWPRGWEPVDEVYADKPVTRRTLELIVAANAHVPPSVTWRRVQFAGVAFLAAVISAYTALESDTFYRAAVEDAYEMAVAALAAPRAG